MRRRWLCRLPRIADSLRPAVARPWNTRRHGAPADSNASERLCRHPTRLRGERLTPADGKRAQDARREGASRGLTDDAPRARLLATHRCPLARNHDGDRHRGHHWNRRVGGVELGLAVALQGGDRCTGRRRGQLFSRRGVWTRSRRRDRSAARKLHQAGLERTDRLHLAPSLPVQLRRGAGLPGMEGDLLDALVLGRRLPYGTACASRPGEPSR